MPAKPRQLFSCNVEVRPKTPWSFETSFFRHYKFDNEEILAKCFEFDWNSGIFERMFKAEEVRVEAKEFLRSIYPLIREAYKHLSNVSPAGQVPCIGTNVLSTCMMDAKDLIDYTNLKLSDVDLAFIASKAASNRIHENEPERCNNPERGLIRFQFMEILCRMGLERFAKKPPNLKHVPALQRFFGEKMNPVLEKYNSHSWRLERYWNEECDLVLKEYESVLKDIYIAFSAPLTPGAPKIMRLN